MGFRERFSPKPTISDQDIASGLRWLTWEGTASMGFFSITTSGFLAAYALLLGCSNFQIGVLAALPFLTQPLQILVIPLVERFRRRKVITLAAWIPAQLSWLLIALIPLFLDVPSSSAVALLLVTIGIRGLFVSITNCSWNSWLRDLIPQQILGSFLFRNLLARPCNCWKRSPGIHLSAALWRCFSGPSQPFIYEPDTGALDAAVNWTSTIVFLHHRTSLPRWKLPAALVIFALVGVGFEHVHPFLRGLYAAASGLASLGSNRLQYLKSGI